jgi:glycosyltransferase involved in cell wall biosynthesis
MVAITVLMSVHNGEAFLRETLDSVAGQTFTDYEFVIVDDFSTDASGAILARAASGDARIRLHRNGRNLGLTRSLNIGLRLARGDYVARIDADDTCLPQRLAVQHAFMAAHHDYVGVTCGFEMIDGEGRRIRRVDHPLDDWQVRWLAGWNPPAPHPTFFFRRLAPDGTPHLYDEEFRTAQDFDLWSRLGAHGQSCVLPQVLVHYRRHDGSITKVKRREQAQNCSAIGRRNLAARLPSGVLAAVDPLVEMFAYRLPAGLAAIKAAVAAGDALLANDLPLAPSAAHRRWLRRMVAGLLAEAVLARAGGLGSPLRFCWAARRHLPWLAAAVLADPGLALKSLRARSAGG